MPVYYCESCHEFKDVISPNVLEQGLILCPECERIKDCIVDLHLVHFLKYHREYVLKEISRYRSLKELQVPQ